jgi:aspartate aminotransferase-like enzyme
MEATVVNLFSPGDAVAAITIGAFGNRFAKIAETFGASVTRIDFPWGQAADAAIVLERLAGIPNLRGVLMTHNETSTGVTNDLKTLAQAIRSRYPNVLIAVDAVSSLGCVDLRMDEWELDVVFTASQKGWMVPPGLAMIGVNARAWEASKQSRMPRMYWDFAWAKRSLDKGQTPYTPPVSIFFGLDVSLEMMRAEGREAIFARHQAVADLTRARARELGLELLADPAFASNTVTAIKVPAGIEVKALRKALREQERVIIGGGQEQLEGKVVRVGHLGHVHAPDITATMDALERQLVALGYQAPTPARPR